MPLVLGIDTSRKITSMPSVTCSRLFTRLVTASRALEASVIVPTRPVSSSSERSSKRAGASSSTISARNMRSPF